ncbi:MAG: hypothetical protein IJK87_06550 [Prevotella sp.]|nr:hypothetical protein [Prevotella sp.]
MRKMFNLMVAAIMMMATSAWGANAASSIVAGKYYLQNVATGLYLNNGSSWGTHAIVNDVGLEFELETEDGGDVMIKNNGFFLSPDSDTHINVWVDYRTEHYWSFQKLSEGIYRIGVNNDGNLTAGSDSIVNIESCTDENAQWKLVTLEDRLKVLNTATRENPVDVSFLIQGANYFLPDKDRGVYIGSHDYWMGDHGDNVWRNSNLGAHINIFNSEDDYDKPFNLYQDCEVRNGTYKLTAQGFYRAKYNYHFLVYGETETLDAILYANKKEQPLVSLMSKENELERYRSDYWGLSCAWPGSNEAAADFFHEGLYVNTIDDIEVTDGKLRIGVKDEATIQHGCWMTCTNFRLYYYGDGTLKEQTLETEILPNMTYGDAALDLPTSTEEGLPLAWNSNDPTIATISDNMLIIKKAGTTTITATQEGNGDYLPFSRDYTLTVQKAELTIKANNCVKNVGEANPELTVTYDGFKYDDNESSLIKQPIVTTTATTNSSVGTYPITVSGAESDNYVFIYVAGTLTVKAHEGEIPSTEIDITDIAGMDNAIYIEPFDARVGDDVDIEVRLKNAESATSYGFELVLPDGMSIEVSDDNDFDSEITFSARHKDHVVTSNKLASNIYKIGVASLSSKTLADNDGTVLSIKAHVAANMVAAQYPIMIQSPLLVKADGTKPTMQETTSAVTIEDYMRGDVDDDGVIDLADAVLVINYYVGKPVNKFVEKAADTDGDGTIDLADAVKIINYYVGKTPSLAREKRQNERNPQ